MADIDGLFIMELIALLYDVFTRRLALEDSFAACLDFSVTSVKDFYRHSVQRVEVAHFLGRSTEVYLVLAFTV